MKKFIYSQLLTDKEWSNLVSSNNSDAYSEQETAQSTDVISLLRNKIKEGMKAETDEIESIISNEESPTFHNTILALAQSGFMLERATTILFNLLSAETNDEMDELANEISPLLSEHENNIMLNAKLFERVKVVYDNERDTLKGEDLMLLNKTYEGFERSGATLSDEQKEKFREITKKLSEYTLVFSQNLLKETNNFKLHITDEAELDGLPTIQREAAKHEAQQQGLDGWVFTLHAPSYGPFMMYSTQREYRKKMYCAYNSRCTHNNAYNNFEVVKNIVNLRRELAQLLGYKNYADYA